MVFPTQSEDFTKVFTGIHQPRKIDAEKLPDHGVLRRKGLSNLGDLGMQQWRFFEHGLDADIGMHHGGVISVAELTSNGRERVIRHFA